MRWHKKAEYVYTVDAYCPACERAKKRAWRNSYLKRVKDGYPKLEAFTYACFDARYVRCKLCSRLQSLRDTIGEKWYHTHLVEFDKGRVVIERPSYHNVTPHARLEVEFDVWVSRRGKFMGIEPKKAILRWGEEVRTLPPGTYPAVVEVLERAILAHTLLPELF